MCADIEASILSSSVVLELGVPNVWAKAISASHARILTQIGVHEANVFYQLADTTPSE